MFYIQERVKNCFLFSTCILNAFMVKVYNARNVFLRHFVSQPDTALNEEVW